MDIHTLRSRSNDMFKESNPYLPTLFSVRYSLRVQKYWILNYFFKCYISLISHAPKVDMKTLSYSSCRSMNSSGNYHSDILVELCVLTYKYSGTHEVTQRKALMLADASSTKPVRNPDVQSVSGDLNTVVSRRDDGTKEQVSSSTGGTVTQHDILLLYIQY